MDPFESQGIYPNLENLSFNRHAADNSTKVMTRHCQNAIDLSFGEVKRGGRILVGMFEETSERMRQLYRLLES